MTAKTFYLANENAMVQLGVLVGQSCGQDATLHLAGNLGMGKTTLSRGVLQAFGHAGAVKSPTYTLVEPYDFGAAVVYHFDLYRLSDPEELEYLGIRDYFSRPALRLIEWPERGAGMLPAPDLSLVLAFAPPGRRAEVVALGARGEEILARLVELARCVPEVEEWAGS